MTQQEKYADKIAKLIAKAESTTPQEAELLLAKAQELMTQYAISEALLDQARGVERDEIEKRDYSYGGYYCADHGNLTWIILQNNGCRGVYMKHSQYTGARTIGDKSYRMWYVITGVGFKSDLDRVSLLEASLQLQMARALHQFVKDGGTPSWMSKTQNIRARQSFMDGFATGVAQKLRAAAVAGTRAAEQDAGEGGKESVALVLRSRKDRVDDWMDNEYGQLRKGRSSSRMADYDAMGAGRAAGSRADVGQPGVQGRKGLNR